MPTDIRRACWDHACPMGLSYMEHLRSLQLTMVQLYFACGGKGVFVAHPMVVALLSVAEPRFGSYEWSLETPHVMAGRVGGVPVWTEPSVRADEVLVVENHDELHALGELRIVNFTDIPEPLDRLAQI